MLHVLKKNNISLGNNDNALEFCKKKNLPLLLFLEEKKFLTQRHFDIISDVFGDSQRTLEVLKFLDSVGLLQDNVEKLFQFTKRNPREPNFFEALIALQEKGLLKQEALTLFLEKSGSYFSQAIVSLKKADLLSAENFQALAETGNKAHSFCVQRLYEENALDKDTVASITQSTDPHISALVKLLAPPLIVPIAELKKIFQHEDASDLNLALGYLKDKQLNQQDNIMAIIKNPEMASIIVLLYRNNYLTPEHLGFIKSHENLFAQINALNKEHREFGPLLIKLFVAGTLDPEKLKLLSDTDLTPWIKKHITEFVRQEDPALAAQIFHKLMTSDLTTKQAPNQSTTALMLSKLNKMKEHGEKKHNTDLKGQEIIKVAEAFKENYNAYLLLKQIQKQPPGQEELKQFQQQFIKLLHSQDTIMARHNNPGRLIAANIIIGVMTALIGFCILIARAINESENAAKEQRAFSLNKVLFFGQTTSEKNIDELESTFRQEEGMKP